MAAGLIGRRLAAEWRTTPFHLISLGGRRPNGLGAAPHDLRPRDPALAEAILGGKWSFVGQAMPVGPTGDPWDRSNPSRAFAEHLHRMDWLGDLIAHGEAGEREALRLVLDWRRLFGRWNAFSWSPTILERRVVNLACALHALCNRASEAEGGQLADSLARQARRLIAVSDPYRAAERLVAATIGGLALGGDGGRIIVDRALKGLDAALAQTVLADGGHASRSPQAGLELLLDLLILDDALSQRGRPAPDELPRAIDRLAGALRTLTLPDGRLGCFQGGEAGSAASLAAARAACDVSESAQPPPAYLPHMGYQRLTGKTLTVMVDVGAPAAGAFGLTACAQPLALEVLSGTERLITNCGWSPLCDGSPALRLTAAGSTLGVDQASAGAPAWGMAASAFGERLLGGAARVERELQETPDGAWLDTAHDGWVAPFGLRHQRLLFVDPRSDELRGEDRLSPYTAQVRPRHLPMIVRFHLAPGVKASLARDGRSVLIQGQTSASWWLRNDAAEVSVEASIHYEDGAPQRAVQVVLRSPMSTAEGGKLRWKLAPA